MPNAAQDPTDYGTAAQATTQSGNFPQLNYKPQLPARYRPGIALVGCGGITEHHLKGYRTDGLDVKLLVDINLEAARKRRDDFYPEADIADDPAAVCTRDDVEVVDVATHPVDRPPLIERFLKAGKHVLSQKPYVLDLDVGEQLARVAADNGVKLAVNQNGRWAPYFAYTREVVSSGLIGAVQSIDMSLAWDHTWIQGTPFETIEHVILYDFAIHWFDICACLMGPERPPQRVYAKATHIVGQGYEPPALASAIVDYGDALATLSFHGHATHRNNELLRINGTEGSLQGTGEIISIRELDLAWGDETARGALEGTWFPDGMRGAMGELLCAIEDDREPSHSAASAMSGLQLCFAALEAARTGCAVDPSGIRAAGEGCMTRKR